VISVASIGIRTFVIDFVFMIIPRLNLYMKERLFPVGFISRHEVDALTARRSHLCFCGVAASDADENFDAACACIPVIEFDLADCFALPESVGGECARICYSLPR